MKALKTSLVAALMLVSAALPAAAITSTEVLTAMNTRVNEISQEMAQVRIEIGNASTPLERALLTRELQMLNARRAQLIALSRVVPRYNERFLIKLVTHFDLDVSLA